MSCHTHALVPIESWGYASPELRARGVEIDIGLFAESLLYYDSVAVNVSSQPQFVEFIRWFLNRNSLPLLLRLLEEGSLKIYDYSFNSAPVLDATRDHYILLNMADPIQQKPNSFGERYLEHQLVRECFPNWYDFRNLSDALEGRVIEAKATDYGAMIDNAREDLINPLRLERLIQHLINALHHQRSADPPPKIDVAMHDRGDGKHSFTYNVDWQAIGKIVGPALNLAPATPLAGAVQANRLLWSAAMLESDLYLPSPMSCVVGDKLNEAITKPQRIVLELQEEVEFPDIRNLVNDGRLSPAEILDIRIKAKPFRDWLQQEADRDRNAIIAYHNEVAREGGFVKCGRKALQMFGLFGAPMAGMIVGAQCGASAGVLTTSGLKFLSDLGSKVGAGWRPVVFGNWLNSKVQQNWS